MRKGWLLFAVSLMPLIIIGYAGMRNNDPMWEEAMVYYFVYLLTLLFSPTIIILPFALLSAIKFAIAITPGVGGVAGFSIGCFCFLLPFWWVGFAFRDANLRNG